MVPVLIVLSVVALLVMIGVAAVRNARAIKRDVEERFKTIDARLKADANSLVDHLLDRER